MKKLFYCLFICVLSTVNAQDVVSRIPLAPKEYSDLFSITDTNNGKTYLFFTLKKKLKCLSLSGDMAINDTMTIDKPDKKYGAVLGYVFVDGRPQIYWSTSDKKKVLAQSIDFSSRTAKEFLIDFDIKDEKYIDAFMHNGKMYVMTLPKKSSQLILYALHGSERIRNVVDLSQHTFYSKSLSKTKMEVTFNEAFSNYAVERVYSDSPVSLSVASHKRKYYLNADNIIITLDLSNSLTQVITIPLQSFEAVVKTFELPDMRAGDSRFISSNSFVAGDLIFQVKANGEKIYVKTSKLTGDPLNEYAATDDEPIIFKNGEIIQENGFTSKFKTLDKTSRYLSKLSGLPIGIAAYQVNGNYLTTIGGIEPEQQGMATYGMFGLVGSLITVAILNSTQKNFTDYANRRIVYVKSYFDSAGRHLSGAAPILAFDKMKEYVNSYTTLPLQTIFKRGNDFYLGYLHIRDKKYVIVKFTE